MRKFIKKTVLLLNILSIFLLLLSWVAQFANPEYLWIIALLGLIYPFLLIVNLLFAFFWIYRGSWFFLLSLLGILLTWTALVNTFQLNFSNEVFVGGGQLKVQTYNVRYFNQYNWIDEDVRTKMIKFINEGDHDVICLQEYWDGNGSNQVKQSIASLNKGRYKHLEYKSRNSHYGLLTLSKYPIKNRDVIHFKNSANMAIQTDIETPSGKVRVFNVHLQSIQIDPLKYTILDSIAGNEESVKEAQDLMGLLKNAFKKRAKQAQEVREAIINSPYPVLVCGDFNDTPVSYAYKTVRGDLKDCFTEAGNGISRTYHGKAPNFRIDFIFCDPAYHVEDYTVNKINYSDHYPVESVIHMN